ncbi:MAG: hypothetical protein ACOC3J_01615 [Gemmatimonadota bacterium]
MLKVRMETERLSVEELANISHALRTGCAECIEKGVAEACRHPEEIERFLNALADAIDHDRLERERRDRSLALGVDPVSGEWDAGA